MRIPLQLAVIFAICFMGDALHLYAGVPVPGNILGMLILLLLLCLKILTPEQISGVSSFFLNHLAFFFLPPSIAIIAVSDDVLSKWPLLLFLCVAITIITLICTGLCTQFLIRKQEFREHIALRKKRAQAKEQKQGK